MKEKSTKGNRGAPKRNYQAMRTHIAILLLSCIAFADGCFQLLDSSASSGGEQLSPSTGGWDGGLSTVILPGSPDYGYFDENGNLVTSDDPCEATRAQAMMILERSCAGCHGGRTPGERAGNPPFDFVLNADKLMSSWSVNSVPPMLFVAAGDPTTSRLFLRIRRGEMPPAIDTAAPRPTTSDISVLHEWISHCAAPPDAGGGDAGGKTGDAGSDDDDDKSASSARRGGFKENARVGGQ